MTSETSQAEFGTLPEDQIRIYNTNRSRICMRRLDSGEKVHGIKLSLVFPLTDRRSFLRVCDAEGHEIGLIRSIDALDDQSRGVVERELERIYFIPKIVKVNAIDDKYGTRTWDVETERGHRTFDVRGRESIRFIAPSHLLVKDVDGNRYEIPSLNNLDAESRQVMETAI